jgi:hypothetical protein
MRWIGVLSIVLSLAPVVSYGDSVPFVTMSGKAITPSAPMITFTIKSPQRDVAKTRVFTLSGNEVAELNAVSLNRFTWDGKDRDQQNVDPGLYVVQILHHGDVWHGPVLVNR